jgi:predicted RNase H-like HicB family nuclease
VNPKRKPLQSAEGDKVLRFSLEVDREEDGRWIAEILEVPGAMAYGPTQDDAIAKAYAIALRTVADNVENSTSKAELPTSIELVREIA